MGDWCLIESDPGVFTDLVRNFGVKGVQVEELYSLDEEAFSHLRPVFGLIFLYKWRAGDEPMGRPVYDAEHIYFAQQVIQNACATQAIINMLLNVEHADVQVGDILTEFKNFSKDFDPANRGLVLGNSEQIRTVHNGYSRPQMFEMMQPQSKDEDAFHFITYVPIRGKVYELDGLREAPLELGTIAEGQDWLDVVRPLINERIAKYSQGEIHFNLMAVVKDMKEKLLQQIQEAVASGQETEAARLQMEYEHEEEKEAKWKLENRRRRHNYIPFIVELLKVLAKEKMLVPLVEEAIEKKQKEKEKKSSDSDAKVAAAN